MAAQRKAATTESTCRRCGEMKQMRLRVRWHKPTGVSWTKPEPYCDRCRNDYRKAARRRKLGLPEDATLPRRNAARPKVERKRRDPATPRTCTICKVFKDGSEYEWYIEKGTSRVASRAMCRPCGREYRRQNLAKNRALEKAGLKKVKADFLCRECKVARVTERHGRCVTCYRAGLRSDLLNATSPPTRNPPQRKEYAPPPISADPPPRKSRAFEDEGVYFAQRRAALLKRKQSAAERGERTGYGIIFLNDTEWWTPGFKCGMCNKGILAFGLCYTCATGMERSVLRPAERVSA